jgi:DNA adenine methylase
LKSIMGIATMHGEGSQFLTLRSVPSLARATAGTITVSRASLGFITTPFLNKQFTASRRGMGRANAPSRRIAPVMIRQAFAGNIPPSNAGRCEHIENKVQESSLISSPVQAGKITVETPLQPVAPVRPAAGYIGGKRNLAGRLVKRIGEVPHTTYAEVFVGMGGIFLRRTARPKAEVINDWSGDVSTFFRVLQRHYVAFVDMMRHQVTSRAQFEKLAALPPESLTDLERSARFLYLQRLAFGGHVAKRTFGVAVEQSARFDITKITPMLEAIHERMAGVVIERLPWSEFLSRYDRPGTLFYLDPPYYGNEADYGKSMFNRAEFAEMAEQLGALKGRFILSLNDRPEVREIFAAFAMDAVETTYTIAAGPASKKAGELIISNC